jgi:hypothetical protein
MISGGFNALAKNVPVGFVSLLVLGEKLHLLLGVRWEESRLVKPLMQLLPVVLFSLFAEKIFAWRRAPRSI